MTSLFKQALINPQTNRIIDRRIIKSTRNLKISGNYSPIDFDRIADDYIDEDYLDNIFDNKSSMEAVNSLLNGNQKRGLRSDFQNLLRGNKERFANELLERYGRININKIKFKPFKFKTKTVYIFRYDNKIYLRMTIAGLRAYTFKNNRFARLPKF